MEYNEYSNTYCLPACPLAYVTKLYFYTDYTSKKMDL